MEGEVRRRRITLVEVLVIFAIVVILLALILPAITAMREAGRRTQCINKMHQLGLALHNYASTNNTFPPSSTMSTSGSTSIGTTRIVTGWSFLYKLAPYMECTLPYIHLPQNVGTTGAQGLIASNASVQLADQTELAAFICPSNSNKHFVGASAIPPTGAITNYKAMSASIEASLEMCVDPSRKPPYGKAEMHPDGAVFPGKGMALSAFGEVGLSHTIALMETQDDKYSRWLVGAEASLVGLPPAINKTITIDKYPYFCPSMFDGKFGEDSAAKAGLRTFLDYDFSPGGKEYGAYAKDKDGDPNWDTTIPNTYMYGPSSAHPNVIVTGFADGNATGFNKRIDAAELFLLITPSGRDYYSQF